MTLTILIHGKEKEKEIETQLDKYINAVVLTDVVWTQSLCRTQAHRGYRPLLNL